MLTLLTAHRIDSTYCSGSEDDPVPNDKFGQLSYTNPLDSVNIKGWIEGIGRGDPSPDALTRFDQSIDSSIGGLGTQMEKMYNLDRSVPLFEFRNLDDVTTSEVEDFMNKVDSAIQDLHNNFVNPPSRKRDVPASCVRSDAPTATVSTSVPAMTQTTSTLPTPTVVAPVDPPSEPSCVPSPTDSVKDAHKKDEQLASQYFCDKYSNDTDAQAPILIAHTIMAGVYYELYFDEAYDYSPDIGNQDNVYDISVTSVPNCTPPNGFNLASPVADTQCADILVNAWKQCKRPYLYPVNAVRKCANASFR